MTQSLERARSRVATAPAPQTESASKIENFMRKHGWFVLALPAAIFLGLVFLIGLVGLLMESLAPGDDGMFGTYINLFNSISFWDALKRTLRLSALSVVFTLLISYPMAYYIARSPEEKRDQLLLFIIIPWLSSMVVRSFGWQIILGNRGPINSFLMAIGVIERPLTLVQNEFGILVGIVHVLAPFMVLTLLSVLVTIDITVEEAGVLLGANSWNLFWRVIWPLSRRGVATGCVLVFLMANAVVVTPLMLGGIRSQTIATMMYSQLLELYNFQRGAALAFILVIIVVPPTLLMNWWGQRGVARKGK